VLEYVRLFRVTEGQIENEEKFNTKYTDDM